MSVKYLGVEVVPIEPWLVRSFYTLMKKDNLINSFYWDHDLTVHWTQEQIETEAKLRPIVEPGLPGERGVYRMFLSDTDEGRKIVLYWNGKTVPILDWSASNGDIQYYLEWLVWAENELLEKAPYFWYRKQRQLETQADLIGKWAELTKYAQDFRNKLLGWEYDPEEDQTYQYDDLKVWIEDPDMEYGLDYEEPDLSILEGEGNVHQVAGAYYYKDTKVCRASVPSDELREYGEACEYQADLILAKYLTVGHSKDYDFWLEKKMRAGIDRLVADEIESSSFPSRGDSQVKQSLLKHTGIKEGGIFERVWMAACRRAYLLKHKLTGVWESPQTLEEVLPHTSGPGLVFDYILHKDHNHAFGDQLSEDFKVLQEQCRVSPRQENRYVRWKLKSFRPVVEAQTRQSGHYHYRERQSAINHYLSVHQ